MLDQLKHLSKQTLIYGLGDAATRAAGLILLPIYTRILSPQDYGKLSMVLLVSTVCSMILEFGLRSAFFRFYFQSEEAAVRRRLTGTTLIFLLVSSVAILLPLILLASRIDLPVFKEPTLLPLIQIALIGTFFDLGSVVPFAIFRAEQRATQYAVLSMARFFINTTLNIIAVVVLGWGVLGVIYASLLTSALFFLICFLLTLRSIEWAIDLNLLKQLLAFGLPLVPAYLGGWALTFSDRFYLERYTDLSQVGVYAIGYSIAGILNMLMGWFNTAWLPYAYSVSSKPDAPAFYSRIFTYALTLFTLFALGLTVFSSEVLHLLATPSYYGAARVVPFIALAYLFYEMNYLIAMGLDLTGKTSYYVVIVGIGAGANLALNFLLIPRFGMMGAAVSTCLSYMLLPIIAYAIVRRFYPVPYEHGRLLKLAFVTVVVCLLSVVSKTSRPGTDLVVSALLILAWGVVLYLWRFFHPKELSAVEAAIRSVVSVCRARLQKGRHSSAGTEG
jgi:O-antigen/teichoic acid export membrane protein